MLVNSGGCSSLAGLTTGATFGGYGGHRSSRRCRNARLAVEPVAAVPHGAYVIEGRPAVARVDRPSPLAGSVLPMISGDQ